MGEKRVVIIGAGPTGLGAAYKLNEIGHTDWQVYERHPHIGGLAASFTDDRGFTWDIGGHVMFSHFPYFDRVVDEALENDYLEHERESWIWADDRFVPYPFQNNIRYLPKEVILECVLGLLEIQQKKLTYTNFREWVLAVFGAGIAKHFMFPYNEKVWKTFPERMDYKWIGERVSVIDLRRILENIILERDDVNWGPNNMFKFPLTGGTGELFERIAKNFRKNISLNHELEKLDIGSKTVYFKNGTSTKYDCLISTMPINQLIRAIEPKPAEPLISAADGIRNVGGYMVGLGFKRPNNVRKCWMYFPMDNSPFYRVTYFSNYSHKNIPDANHFSIIAETSYSDTHPVPSESIVEETVQGLINSKIIEEADRGLIVSEFVYDISHNYPVPIIGRDKYLKPMHEFLEGNEILSRGRFGGWKYEIGNTDHSFMQGVEAVGALLKGEPETVWIPST